MKLPYKFVVSGSGSLELKEDIQESLAGRKRTFSLDTLSFDEFVNYKTEYKYETRLQDFFKLQPIIREELLLEYLNFGGYPRVVLASTIDEKKQIINEIYQTYLERDISYLGVQKTEAFSQLIKIIASQTGQLVNYNELSNTLGISSKTVKDYLWYAEKTFVIRKLVPYFKNTRKEIVKSPIYHFRDLGMRNFSLRSFGNLKKDQNLGLLFENFIFLLLWEEVKTDFGELKFWRTKYGAEVDFIYQQGNRLIPIEAKYKNLKKPTISRSMRSFLESYQPAEAYIVNLSLEKESRIKSTKIKFLRYYQSFSNLFATV